MNKILFVATIDQHIMHFHYPFLKWFKENGYEVHVASNGHENLQYVDKKHFIPFERSPLKKNNIISFFKLRKLINENDYQLIHCHTPMGGVITRLVYMFNRNEKSRLVYTAHGFHFFKGSPSKNWILYYPIEKFLSKYTDVLITINQEDFNLAISKKFNSKKIKLVNGVGINLRKFKPKDKQSKLALRKKYGYNEEDFIGIYVGELSYRKHQDVLIEAAQNIVSLIPNFKLLLVGNGDMKAAYMEQISANNLWGNIDILGYRKDIASLMQLSDFGISSSRQEGLPVNIMEAMASGLPVIASDCRGNRDLVTHEKNGFIVEIDDAKEYGSAMLELYRNQEYTNVMSRYSVEYIYEFSEEKIVQIMSGIYSSILNSKS